MKIITNLKEIIFFTFISIHIIIAGENPVKTSTNVDGIGTASMTFLEIGIGARAMGMGGAFVAVANDASATYWNPAGIVWADKVQVEISHNKWFLDSKLQSLSGVIPLPQFNSSMALSIVTLGFDEQAVRTVERPTGTGEMYDARDFSVALSWATAVTDRFSFGLSAKYLTSRIWHESANAFALDFGIFYNTELKGLRLGFSMANFGSGVKFEGRDLDSTIDPDKEVENFDRAPAQLKTDSYPLPILFRAGISYELNLDDFGNAIFAADLLHPSHSPEAINVGLEYGFTNMFFVRAGYQNLFEDTSIDGLTLGAGIDYYNSDSGFGARFDYSWADWGNLKNAQRFSVGIIF